jgi:hypothetical protein
MRAFLSRWRWHLLAVALCLAIAGSLGFLLLDQRRPHGLRQAFGRVEFGMSESAVRAILGQDVLREIDNRPRGGPALIPGAIEAIEVGKWEGKLEESLTTADPSKWTTYQLKSGDITVCFFNGRVLVKKSARYPTAWERMLAFLERIRAAVGL